MLYYSEFTLNILCSNEEQPSPLENPSFLLQKARYKLRMRKLFVATIKERWTWSIKFQIIADAVITHLAIPPSLSATYRAESIL